MAYATSAPPLLVASAKDGSSPQIWSYTSTDSISTVGGTGYFTDATNLGMRVGDKIIVSESDNDYVSQVLTVSAITSGAATAPGAQDLSAEAGVGITAGVGTIYESSVTRAGGIITTRILIDITGLNHGGTAGDIIGVDGTGVAHLGRITTARCGTIIAGRMTCFEAPLTGDPDIDLYSATEGTGVEDVGIGTLTETQLINAGAATAGAEDVMTALPAAGSYLYLVGQGAAGATYTAGIFLIELYGI